MSAKTDIFWQRVEDFEARARASADPGVSMTYSNLAAGYRRLIQHIDQPAKLFVIDDRATLH